MSFLRSKPFAATFFKTTGGPGTKLNGLPRYKYMYYANFVPSGEAIAASASSGLNYLQLGTYQEGISFKINSIDKPKVELNVQELNQYNRKRYAYTKVEYQPLNIKIHDTVDDIPLRLWHDYFTYYFSDSRAKTGTDNGNYSVYNYSVTDGDFANTYNTGYGLNPKNDRYNFFSRIELYALFGKTYTQINYINPRITNIDWGNYENASGETGELSMTLRYEAIEYKAIAAPMTAEKYTQFGFNIPNTLSGVNIPVPSVEVQDLAQPTNNLKEWVDPVEVKGVDINFQRDLRRRRTALIPDDIALSTSRSLFIANSTLNLFSQQSIGAVGTQVGLVIGQGGLGVSASANFGGAIVNGQLLTNPAGVSGYVGAGVAVPSLPNPMGSSLGSYGAFNFGAVSASGGVGISAGFSTGGVGIGVNASFPVSDTITVVEDWDDAGTIS